MFCGLFLKLLRDEEIQRFFDLQKQEKIEDSMEKNFTKIGFFLYSFPHKMYNNLQKKCLLD